MRERLIKAAKYSQDRRSLTVLVDDSAPGGERWEKIAIPFDPDLFEHMIEHK